MLDLPHASTVLNAPACITAPLVHGVAAAHFLRAIITTVDLCTAVARRAADEDDEGGAAAASGDWHQVERFDFQRPSPIKSDINAPSALINRAAYSACLAVVLMGCHQTSHTHGLVVPLLFLRQNACVHLG
jgi:hypothetical protein